MSATYQHVFSAIKIGPVEVKNRLFIPAHGLHVMTAGGPHGSLVPSADWAQYLAERAAGGVGLLFLTMTTNPRIRGASPLFEESIPSFKAVADLVHGNGAKIFAQVHMREGGTPWEPMGAMSPLLVPSEQQNLRHRQTTAREMSVGEIAKWVAAQGQCARNLTRAGYDGIEIHLSHGMLMEMFLSPYFNRRLDGYGGDLEGRLRLTVESLQEVRRNVSAQMAVGVRLICDEMLPGGLTQNDAREVLGRLVELRLLDFANLDVAVEPQQAALMTAPQFTPPLHIVGFSGSVGRAVKGRIVVMGAAGRLTTVAQAEKLIADGVLDMVGAVREFIAEPELIKNALEGREDRSRTCVASNFCFGTGRPGRVGWGCVINPATGRERTWGVRTFTPAAKRSKVVVAGAGPAGLEAARVAAKLGHEVVVFERRAKIGGQLNLWAGLPGREGLFTTVSWYRRQLGELGVEVRTGVEATAEMVLAEKPDAVLVATGSRYEARGESAFVPTPIPGADHEFVYAPEQILEDGARPGGNVLVLDVERIHTGVGVAEVLAAAGAHVEIVTPDLHLVGEALSASLEFSFIIPKLEHLGVKLTIATFLRAIGDHEATLTHVLTDKEEVRRVDAVVLATMRRSEHGLAKNLEGRVAQLYLVGDALAPRWLFEATYEGQRFARLVGKDGAPRDSLEAQALFTPPTPVSPVV